MKYLGPPQSGSYQGVTFSRNRNGQYIRSRAVPVQPRTTFQLNVRARLAAVAASYRSLSDYERLAWGSLGAQMSRTDSLGQVRTLTASQAQVSVNAILEAYAQAAVTAAPPISTPSPPASLVLVATHIGPLFTVATTAEPLTGFLGIFASPPVSQGRVSTPQARLVATFPVGGSPYDITAAWQNRFGTLSAGQKITIFVRSMLDGFESVPVTASVVTA